MSPILQSLANGSAQGYGAFFGAGAAGAFESIATATGTGSSATITFSSIPSTYQHLQIRCITQNGNTAANGICNVDLRFNSDSATNYSYHSLDGDGSTANASGVATQSEIRFNTFGTTTGTTQTNIVGAGIIDIHDYASTTKNKTVRAFHGVDTNTASTNFKVTLTSGLWRSTSAITSLTLQVTANNLSTKTVYALYGIKA